MQQITTVSNAIKNSQPPIVPIKRQAVFGAAPSLRGNVLGLWTHVGGNYLDIGFYV
jgi:hypothetical protein